MKTVGKQLQEARLAKNWTPELAARETKIKVDRLHDLETDDYSHFTSPTYARGFVRTYARALGLDEYRILRQLDNKLPEDDTANIVTDNSGVAYLPETAMPPRVAHRDFTGLYIVMGLGAVVTLAIVFVLFEAYRVGELTSYFGNNQDKVASAPATTNSAPASTNAEGEIIARAKPVDPNTPPPPIEVPAVTNAPVAAAPTTNAPTDTAAAPRALPVNASAVVASADTNAAASIPVAPIAPRALPVDGSTPLPPISTPVPTAANSSVVPPSDAAPVIATNAPPRALPVSPSDLAAAVAAQTASTTGTNTVVALNSVPVPVPAPVNPRPLVHSSASARQSNSGPVVETSMPPVAPTAEATPAPATTTAPVPGTPTPVYPVPAAMTNTAPAPVAPAPAPVTQTPTADTGEKRLVLTASQDSFVRVTKLDGPSGDKPLCARVLHSGESIGFDGRKFSINVGIPSAVDIKLDGVNYGPHSDQDAPETFIVQSHLP